MKETSDLDFFEETTEVTLEEASSVTRYRLQYNENRECVWVMPINDAGEPDPDFPPLVVDDDSDEAVLIDLTVSERSKA